MGMVNYKEFLVWVGKAPSVQKPPFRPASRNNAANSSVEARSERQEEEQEQARQQQVIEQGEKEWKARVEHAELAYKQGRLADALELIEAAFSQRLGNDKNAAIVSLRNNIEEAATAQDRQFRCGLALSSPYQGQHASWALARQQARSLPLSDVCLVEQNTEAEWSLLSWEQRWSVIQRELPRLRVQRAEARRTK